MYKFEGRRSGRTTRLIDHLIQELFTNHGKWVSILDHHRSKKSHKLLMDKIVTRIKLEHPNAKVVIAENKLKLT